MDRAVDDCRLAMHGGETDTCHIPYVLVWVVLAVGLVAFGIATYLLDRRIRGSRGPSTD